MAVIGRGPDVHFYRDGTDALDTDDGGFIWLQSIAIDPKCQRQGRRSGLVAMGLTCTGTGCSVGLTASDAGRGLYLKEGMHLSEFSIRLWQDPGSSSYCAVEV